MRLTHFETLAPVCPFCQHEHGVVSPLSLYMERQEGEHVLEGYLKCGSGQCLRVYPIIDGVPVLIPHIKKYLRENLEIINSRNDLSPLLEALLGDASGSGSVFNTTRHHLGSYAWDHYGDFAAQGSQGDCAANAKPGNALACLQAALELHDRPAQAPVLDVGCAVGRTSFELALLSGGLCLGVDINFSLLRTAQQVLQTGKATYPLKQLGLVHERQHYEVSLEQSELVDFWACDAQALPFENQSFQFVSALNVFDVVTAPRRLLGSLSNALKSQGLLVLATPYDWGAPVKMADWVGGYEQYEQHQGDSEELLRQLLGGGRFPRAISELQLVAEKEHFPWQIRVHKRRTASYDVHIMACEKL